MSNRGIHRRLVALVAAYALALQGLLTAIAAVSPALATETAICAAAAPSHDAGRNGPAHHPDCPFCALACGGAAALPASVASAILTFGLSEPIPALHAPGSLARPAVLAGLARAPPA